MDPNQKLSLRYRVQRSIRRRKQESPFWYLLMAAVLVGACFLLKYFPIEGKIPEYDGLAGKEGFTATFTGNVNSVGDGATLTAKDYSAYFDGVRDMLSKADYLSVPINDPILDDYIEAYQSAFAIRLSNKFIIDPNAKLAKKYFNTEVTKALTELGVNDATIGSVDMFRYGSKGALETARTLAFEGINASGIDTTKNHDAAITTEFEQDGIRILHVGIEASDDKTRPFESYDLRTYNDRDNQIERDIRNLREQNPDAFIAVTVNWAEYYLLKPSSYMKKLSRMLIDCGADVVIGSGTQTVLSAEKYGGGYIFYGLGNLVADEAYAQTQRGAVLNCVFGADGKVTYELVPLNVREGKPTLTGSKTILRTLASDLGKGADYKIEDGRLIITK